MVDFRLQVRGHSGFCCRVVVVDLWFVLRSFVEHGDSGSTLCNTDPIGYNHHNDKVMETTWHICGDFRVTRTSSWRGLRLRPGQLQESESIMAAFPSCTDQFNNQFSTRFEQNVIRAPDLFPRVVWTVLPDWPFKNQRWLLYYYCYIITCIACIDLLICVIYRAQRLFKLIN